ncbi:MAG: DUF4037 domain-containing protein [Acutalibacteraceae bacterium]|nr:DUF4037 domain-containing protein [Acutalibacteraceae bacterium]
MKGLDLALSFFKEYGEPMLSAQFPEVSKYIAVGLVGSGSECYGYDDEISRDHDFEPAFCIFIPDEDIINRKVEFELERAYAKLPKEYCGFKRAPLNPVGGNRHGVIRMGDFYAAKTGSRDGQLSVYDWFNIPEHSLLEATNGEVFLDNYGLFTGIREKLSYYPDDIRLKKIAGNLLLMGQSGQYNYNRLILRNDTAAAQLAVTEFVKSAMNVVFLLNRRYMPYYKWSFCALRKLPFLSQLSLDFEFLISSGNDDELAKQKSETIENVCQKIAAELDAQGIARKTTTEMEQLAYAVNDKITDNEIRNLNILYGV